MVTVIEKKKGNNTYYYLRHDDGKTQRELYIGKKLPKNIHEISRMFHLRVLRESWRPSLLQIKQKHSEFLQNATIGETENYQEMFSYGFTHDSNKIEGSSLTRQETYNLLRFKITPANKPESDMIEAKNHHAAFLDMLRGKRDMTYKNTLRWHLDIFQDTMPGAGRIRESKIIVRGSRSTFPHPHFVHPLLKQFFKWHASSKADNPVELAGLVHFRFVSIHPFADGNGRMSRLLMNNVLNRHGYPMLNIRFSDRHYYYAALEKAQVGLDETVFLKWFVNYYIRQSSG